MAVNRTHESPRYQWSWYSCWFRWCHQAWFVPLPKPLPNLPKRQGSIPAAASEGGGVDLEAHNGTRRDDRTLLRNWVVHITAHARDTRAVDDLVRCVRGLACRTSPHRAARSLIPVLCLGGGEAGR